MTQTQRTIYTYIWTDAAGRFRSKVRAVTGEATRWNYDGSSTGQATTEESEIDLVPLAEYTDQQTGRIYVLCGTYTQYGEPTAAHAPAHGLDAPADLRIAFEQEFFVYDERTRQPYRFAEWSNCVQGEFYCSVGAGGNGMIEPMVAAVFERGLRLGLSLTGYNLEVAPAQGEIQVDAYGVRAAHDLIMLRYLLWDELGRHGCYPVFDPKPLGADWNGSGLHTNVSTDAMRCPEGGWTAIERLLARLEAEHAAWMPLLGGDDNRARLTGTHETSSYDQFTWGIGSRAASVRVPRSTWAIRAGYIEDRRPAANANPYHIVRLYAAAAT